MLDVVTVVVGPVANVVLGGTEDPFFDETDYRATVAGLPDADRVRFEGVATRRCSTAPARSTRAVVRHPRP